MSENRCSHDIFRIPIGGFESLLQQDRGINLTASGYAQDSILRRHIQISSNPLAQWTPCLLAMRIQDGSRPALVSSIFTTRASTSTQSAVLEATFVVRKRQMTGQNRDRLVKERLSDLPITNSNITLSSHCSLSPFPRALSPIQH